MKQFIELHRFLLVSLSLSGQAFFLRNALCFQYWMKEHCEIRLTEIDVNSEKALALFNRFNDLLHLQAAKGKNASGLCIFHEAIFQVDSQVGAVVVGLDRVDFAVQLSEVNVHLLDMVLALQVGSYWRLDNNALIWNIFSIITRSEFIYRRSNLCCQLSNGTTSKRPLTSLQSCTCQL